MRKKNLSELVQSSQSFEIFKSFLLADGSNAKVYKRKIDSISVNDLVENKKDLELNLIKINNGFQIKIKGKKSLLENSYLLINIDQDEEIYELNVSLPDIKNISKNENILIEKNIKSHFLNNDKTSPKISGSLITKKNKSINLDNISYENIELIRSDNDNTQILEINKLEELEKMGKFLKEGEFDELFSLVGLINQTDPKQNYLKDGELIFKERLKLDENNLIIYIKSQMLKYFKRNQEMPQLH